jgi:hypothetical protein
MSPMTRGENRIMEIADNTIRVQRFSANPLITSASSPTLGTNINGPSVIRVPEWLPEPLGRYYMYFAHHAGVYIRLAYADALEGPWKIYEPGTLHLSDAKAFCDHIASPDVHIDHEMRQIRMYFHAPSKARPGQWTGVAYSRDGLRFVAKPDLLGKFYFRVWTWRNHWYALAKNNNEGWGELYRASDPDGPFELRENFLKGMRHGAVMVEGDRLSIFYSRVGDAPERILMATVDMCEDWTSWFTSEPVEVLRPAELYEGVKYPIAASGHGSAIGVHQLRDPHLMVEERGKFLFYTGAGEAAICGSRVLGF